MKIRDIIRSLEPTFLLNNYRKKQKEKQRQSQNNLGDQTFAQHPLNTKVQDCQDQSGYKYDGKSFSV